SPARRPFAPASSSSSGCSPPRAPPTCATSTSSTAATRTSPSGSTPSAPACTPSATSADLRRGCRSRPSQVVAQPLHDRLGHQTDRLQDLGAGGVVDELLRQPEAVHRRGHPGVVEHPGDLGADPAGDVVVLDDPDLTGAG